METADKEAGMAEILVARAPAAGAQTGALADMVVSRLEKLGFKVSDLDLAAPRKALTSAVGKAQGVLVLWSREAPLALRTVATAAKEAGKLAVARLDAAAPPPILHTPAADLSRWSGRAETRGWRRLMQALPAPAGVKPKAKREGFVWLFLLAGLAVSAAAAAGAYVMLR